MNKIILILVGLALVLPGALAQPKPKPKPTPDPKQLQKAQLTALLRLQQAQRSALLAQARALKAQQARLTKSRQAQAKAAHSPKSPRPPQAIVAARLPAPTPKPTPTPAPSPPKFTGVITAIDLEKNTVTVQRENVEITYTFLPTVSLNFYSGDGHGLKSLTKGTTIEVTSADGKRADMIVVHDLS